MYGGTVVHSLSESRSGWVNSLSLSGLRSDVWVDAAGSPLLFA